MKKVLTIVIFPILILGLLYGQGDFEKTIDISTRAGQDSDCNPASSGGIVATMLGYERLPEKYKKEMELIADRPFNNTVSFLRGSELSFSHALEMIKRGGGTVDSNEVHINYQIPEPARLEVGFENLKVDKKVVVDNWVRNIPAVEFEGVGLQASFEIQSSQA